MGIYIFCIFAFGLVITGIVFLGIQQASEQAKAMAEHRGQPFTAADQQEHDAVTNKPPFSASQP